MTNLEKHREEFVKTMKSMVTCGCSTLLKCTDLDCIDFKNCGDCANAFVDWLLEEAPVDWSQVEPGTKCLVRDDENDPWITRYFAVFSFGKPWFLGAGVSLTDIGDALYVFNYRYCKLKED